MGELFFFLHQQIELHEPWQLRASIELALYTDCDYVLIFILGMPTRLSPLPFDRVNKLVAERLIALL